MTDSWSDSWADVEEVTRDALICLTALIPHDKAAGVVLALGMAATRGVVNVAYAAEQAVKLPFRAAGWIK